MSEQKNETVQAESLAPAEEKNVPIKEKSSALGPKRSSLSRQQRGKNIALLLVLLGLVVAFFILGWVRFPVRGG